MPIEVRDMTRADVGDVGTILFGAFSLGATKHGYTPKLRSAEEATSWAWALLRLHPHEILIGELDARPVGMCCLNPRGTMGGIGPVAVDPAFQGQGIGRALMNALLVRAAGLESVRLFQEAFNAASFSMYYSLGFIPVADLLDMTLSRERKPTDPCQAVSQATVQHLDELVAYDLPRGRLDRRSDLEYYIKWGKVLVYRDQARIRGFLACLPGSQSVQLGPLVAEAEPEARCLFQHALALFDGRACQTRVMARDRDLSRGLEDMGFRLYCLDLLMVRGAWRPTGRVEAFGRFPEGV